MKHLLIFDLDGTLIDSKADLAAAVNHVRRTFDLEPLPVPEIAGYLGEGVELLLRRSLPERLFLEHLASARSRFFDFYGQHLLDQTGLFPGVRQALDALHCHALAVLSNKPVAFSRAVIQGLGLGEVFARVYGGDSFDQRKPHPIGILRLMQEIGTSPSTTAMIGDSAVDVRAGRKASVRTFGMRYGYASASFRDAPPDVLLDGFEGLVPWFPACPS